MWCGWLLVASALTSLGSAQDYQFDVIVYGATPAGVAAAVMAANNTGLRVALIEATPRVGGMATAGGIGLKDLDASQWFDVMFAPGSVARRWIELNGAPYGVPYALQVRESLACSHDAD